MKYWKQKIYICILSFMALLLFPSESIAQEQEGTLLGNWQNDDLPEAFYGRYNEVWAVIVNGVEYGVIGSTMGTHFISLEPVNGVLEEIAFVPGGAQGSNIIHRDFDSYQNYLYAVADEGSSSTLQIIDFSGLPGSVDLVYDSNEFIVTAHNIFIDKENARLYSTNSYVLSLVNPSQPTVLSTGFFGGHDIFARDNILIVNEGNNGMRVIDYNDTNNPVVLGSLTDYNNSGYNHSGWMSEDNSHYFLCDETGGALVKSVDITDFSDMEVVDMFKADNDNPEHIAHNAMVLGNLLYVSYYTDGLAIFDITDPSQVVRKYFYDTYPGIDDSGFKGAWGVYSFLPSGRILVSDLNTGLYLIEFPEDQTIFALESELIACSSEDISFDVLVGYDFAESGITLSASGLPSGVSATFSNNPAAPGEIVEVTISGISSDINFDLGISADDGNANSSTSVPVEVLPTPDALALSLPEDGSIDVHLFPIFEWELSNGLEKRLEVSTFPNFDNVDVLSEVVFGSSYEWFGNALEGETTYYWRVTFEDDCGTISSAINSFTTFKVLDLKEIEDDLVSINPNPVRDDIQIEMGEYFQGDVEIELFDVNGKSVRFWNIFNADQQMTLTSPVGLEGVYLLRLSNQEYTLTKKVLFER